MTKHTGTTPDIPPVCLTEINVYTHHHTGRISHTITFVRPAVGHRMKERANRISSKRERGSSKLDGREENEGRNDMMNRLVDGVRDGQIGRNKDETTKEQTTKGIKERKQAYP